MYFKSQNSNLGALGLTPQYGAWFETIVGVVKYDYNDAIYRVYQAVNLDDSVLNYLPFVNTYSFDECKNIINSYVNLVESNTIPEWETGDREKIIAEVARSSSRSVAAVRVVLTSLAKLTHDGSVRTSEVIAPLTYTQNEEIREGMNIHSAGGTTKALDFLADAATTTLYIVGAGLIGYGIYRIIK